LLVVGFSSRPFAIAAQSTPQPPADRCRVEGRATSSGTALPGVSIGVRSGDATRALTSTEIDGRYSLTVTPGATYRLVAELAGFAPVEHAVTVGAPPCTQTVDFVLALAPRTATALAATTSAQTTPEVRGNAGRGSTAVQSGRGANAARAGRGAARIETLTVAADPNAAAVEPPSAADEREIASMLPPGFAVESAQSDAIAITGASSATDVNRGLMNDRMQAIALGQFDPATGQFAAGFGAGDGTGFGGPGGPGGFGRDGGPGGFGGRGGPGGRGGFVLGGRGARGQNPYQGSVNYTFGGSALDSPPYQLRSDVPVSQPQFAQNNFGATFGGPLKIPGLYANTNRRTNFQLNYSGTEANNVFDQYATVPTDAMRSGDFSAESVQLIDPSTGQPFAGNRIPASRIDPSAASLLQFIPSPNLAGNTRNFHVSTTAHSSSEAISLRLTQNLSPQMPPQGGQGRPGGRGGFGGGFGGGFPGGGGFGGRGGGPGGPAGARRTNIVLNAQLQYRENTSDALNVFPGLGGTTVNRSLTVPLSLNVVRGRTIQNFSVNMTHATTTTTNGFANTDNVAALAGIQYPTAAATDPNNWGVPNLTFSSFTGLRGAAATGRTDDRLSADYMWLHPVGSHRLRAGANVRLDRASYEINSNARGTFTFTGLYSSGGASRLDATGADFADFLLGLPQEATLQVGGTSQLRQRSVSAYLEDNWQKNAKLTFNLGLRYELALPYVEVNGRMANLDASSDLSSVAAVLPGAVGPFTGMFPAGLLNTDANNIGPRVGVAYRLKPNTILRGGYSITYNSGSYASIARQLSGQPPFADTETIAGADDQPLTIGEALLAPPSTTTNNWGVDRDYALGMIQTWNATLLRNLTQDWTIQAGYTGIKGTDLDILRAPALGAGGVPIPGVQGFIWESSGGRSTMNAGNVQLRRRLAGGFSGTLSYTYAHAYDDASSLGAGGAVVAQNDRDLAAEWGRSSFERRQQVSGSLYVELPWGPNRHWLKNGGTLAGLFGEWSAQLTLTVQSGPPLTARVLGAASDLLRGVNGSLRANYNGAPIQLSDPTVDEFFNTTAFTVPGVGAFGDAARNTIIGPGQRQLNALFQRDIRVGGSRSLTLQVNALNLLNAVQWAAIDTNVNSPTFGEVLSARPMRTTTITARMRF
jgi:hypothetical protein